MDLEYTKKAMIESGIPDSIAEYITVLNRSIVTLTDNDEVDESDSRLVLQNSDGSPNPNLTPKEYESLQDLSESELREKGYSLKKEKGVPQGASTSCGLSTLNLKELYLRYPDRLVGYADDGITTPKSCVEDPMISVPSAGVYINDEKSH